jgi:hypothetical protein
MPSHTFSPRERAAGHFGDEDQGRALYPELFDPLIDRLLATAQPDGGFAASDEARAANRIVHRLIRCINDKNSQQPRRWHRVKYLADYRWVIHEARDFDLDLNELRDAVREYLQLPWMHTPALDWLCADVLTWTTYKAVAEARTFESEGYWNSTVYVSKEEPGLESAGKLLLIWLAKWGVWAGVLYWLYEKTGVVGLIIQIALTLPYVGIRLQKKRKVRRMMAAMQRVYACLDSRAVAWSVVAREMEDARKLGAWWPGELWQLAEARALSSINEPQHAASRSAGAA